MKLIQLNCPACSATLDIPSNLAVAHCVYCGNKILLEPEGSAQERGALERYVELCKVAVEAKNHNDVIRYCNSILEIDPQNIQAWIDKATSTFWLTTGLNNRYDEAMEYLNKASEIDHADTRIVDTRNKLTRQQAIWYNHLGNQKWELALDIFNIHRTAYLFGDGYGKEQSQEHAVAAMNYYLRASDYAPDDVAILQNIAHCAEFYDVVKWSDRVCEKIKTLSSLGAKTKAEQRLLQVKVELENARAELARLQIQKGLFISRSIKSTEQRMCQLQAEIPPLEKAAAYCPPSPFARRAETHADPFYARIKEMLSANGTLKLDDITRELGIERQRAAMILGLIVIERNGM